MRLRWKKWPKETGLRSVGENMPSPSDYHDGDKTYATVQPLGRRSQIRGWFFYGTIGKDTINTAHSPLETEKDAKKAAVQWVREKLTSNTSHNTTTHPHN